MNFYGPYKSILKEAVGRGQYWFLMSINPILTNQIKYKDYTENLILIKGEGDYMILLKIVNGMRYNPLSE
jgi:hypothetical protein